MRAGGEHLVPRRTYCGDVTEIAEIGVIRLLSYLRQALVRKAGNISSSTKVLQLQVVVQVCVGVVRARLTAGRNLGVDCPWPKVSEHLPESLVYRCFSE